MSEHIDKIEDPPADVSLMLRAHAELRCLSREVIPVLRQVNTREGLPDEQLGAAIAYLEVTWLQAQRRAMDTDAAHRKLMASVRTAQAEDDGHLHFRARRYYDAVKALRAAVGQRVAAVLWTDEHQALPVAEAGQPSGC